MGNHEFDGLTRRETLKRGLKIGAVLWVTPVVQVVGMRPAFAQTPSPVPCENVLRAKWELDENAWEADPGVGANDCTDCGGAEGVDGSLYFTIIADEDEATVTLIHAGCVIISVVAKGGNDDDPEPPDTSCSNGVVAPGGQSATVQRPDAGGISHVEVCFCCDDDNNNTDN